MRRSGGGGRYVHQQRWRCSPNPWCPAASVPHCEDSAAVPPAGAVSVSQQYYKDGAVTSPPKQPTFPARTAPQPRPLALQPLHYNAKTALLRSVLRGRHCSLSISVTVQGRHCSLSISVTVQGRHCSLSISVTVQGRHCSLSISVTVQGRHCSLSFSVILRGRYCCPSSLSKHIPWDYGAATAAPHCLDGAPAICAARTVLQLQPPLEPSMTALQLVCNPGLQQGDFNDDMDGQAGGEYMYKPHHNTLRRRQSCCATADVQHKKLWSYGVVSDGGSHPWIRADLSAGGGASWGLDPASPEPVLLLAAITGNFQLSEPGFETLDTDTRLGPRRRSSLIPSLLLCKSIRFTLCQRRPLFPL